MSQFGVKIPLRIPPTWVWVMALICFLKNIYLGNKYKLMNWLTFYLEHRPILKYKKIKCKFHPKRDHESPRGEQMYRSAVSLTSALVTVGGQLHTPTTLNPGRRAGINCTAGCQSRSGLVGKISLPPWFDSRTVQPVACRYTRYTRYFFFILQRLSQDKLSAQFIWDWKSWLQ